MPSCSCACLSIFNKDRIKLLAEREREVSDQEFLYKFMFIVWSWDGREIKKLIKLVVICANGCDRWKLGFLKGHFYPKQ